MEIEAYDDDPKTYRHSKYEKKNALVIFHDSMPNKTAQTKAGDVFTKGRPHKMNIIFITQSYYGVPRRTIRNNAKFQIIFYQDDRALPRLHRDVVK